MKGIAGLMAMMAAVVLAMMVAGFSVPISQSLANEAGEPIGDIAAVSELNAYSSNYVHDYLRQAARYSLHNKSYELGQQGGEMDWTSSKVSSDIDRTYECGDENRLQELNCRLQEAAAKRTAGYGWESSRRCSVSVKKPEFNVTEKDSRFNASSVELDCDIKQRSMQRTVEDVELNFSSSRVRFQTLAHTAYSYMNELEGSWSADKYSGDAYSCGSPDDEDYEEAEEEATDSADSAVSSNFDSISVSLPQGIELESSIVDTPDELSYGTDPETFSEADQDVEVEEGDCCSRDDEGACTAYDNDIYMNVTPEESEVELSAKDTENNVLLNDGWKSLEFVVENYVHSFD